MCYRSLYTTNSTKSLAKLQLGCGNAVSTTHEFCPANVLYGLIYKFNLVNDHCLALFNLINNVCTGLVWSIAFIISPASIYNGNHTNCLPALPAGSHLFHHHQFCQGYHHLPQVTCVQRSGPALP